MRISFKLNRLDSHAHFGVFINGAKAGDLCLRADEYYEFVALIQDSHYPFELNDNRKEEQ